MKTNEFFNSLNDEQKRAYLTFIADIQQDKKETKAAKPEAAAKPVKPEAAAKPVKPEAAAKPEAKVNPANEIKFSFKDSAGNKFSGAIAAADYSEKAFAISGQDSRIISEALKLLGRWNFSTKCWFISKNKLENDDLKGALNRKMFEVYGVADSIK